MARAKKKGFGGPGGRAKPNAKRRKSRFREQAKCRFCREKTREVDYKSFDVLDKLVTQHGKLFSRKRSGNCAAHQRSCKRALKRARFIGLMPYVT
jgi:small subunit ribosomal protein S18